VQLSDVGTQRQAREIRPAQSEQVDSAWLSAAAARAMTGWSPSFRNLVELADPTTLAGLPIHSSLPAAP
jgi:hypothetical protein